MKDRIPYAEAKREADAVVELLAPHCERIEIAGSIRRKKSTIGDIEIVAIPKPYDVGLFANGIAAVVDQWEPVKGELPCKYTQRILPSGMKLDLFLATPDNWGLILAIRTGSAAFSHKVLASAWTGMGYKSDKGMLHSGGMPVPVREEEHLFTMCGLKWVPPEERELSADLEPQPAGGMEVTCLTVLEPYAYLIVFGDNGARGSGGHKNVENRTWHTNFRGRLYVHSGRRLYEDPESIAEGYGQDVLEACMRNRGKIIGYVDLVDCVTDHPSRWFYGPYGFVLRDPTPIEPIPYRGAQGFWKARIPG